MRYQIGDRLQIRYWEDMVAEYGLDGENIPVTYIFTPDMKYMCGQPFTVKDICGGRYVSEEGIENTGRAYSWKISEDMLEYIDEDTSIEFSEIELLELLLTM